MSESPAAAQAGADNQRFWNGIARLPEEAQKSFWDAGVLISRFIGENPSPRTLTFDISRPPAEAAWWERVLFYVGQGQYNQSVAQAQAGAAMADGAQWLWGALQGDFNKNPTTGQVITGGIISMIPIVDQACDVRDIVANCIDLSDEEARKDGEKWLALGLTSIGFLPAIGSAVKTVAKSAWRTGARLLDVLKHMEWIEKNYRKLKIACPWGFAPIEWLRKFDWIGQLRKAGSQAKKAFENALVKTQAAMRYAAGAVQAKLSQLASLFKAVVAKIEDTMVELGRKLKAKLDELLGGAKKEAGNFDATPGGPNKHGQGDREPSRQNRGSPLPYKTVDELSAAQANARHIKAGFKPPYAEGSKVRDVRFADESTLVRVHGAKNKARSWMMRKEDIDGLSPSQIRDRFALPEPPTFVSDVKIPAGTVVRVGEVAPQAGWGRGGGTQFELLSHLPESNFINTRPLGGP